MEDPRIKSLELELAAAKRLHIMGPDGRLMTQGAMNACTARIQSLESKVKQLQDGMRSAVKHLEQEAYKLQISTEPDDKWNIGLYFGLVYAVELIKLIDGVYVPPPFLDDDSKDPPLRW